MILTQIQVGFPMLHYEVRVFHSIPRPPTAFERVLLEMCSRFENDKTYKEIPIDIIFSEYLGVVDPAFLIRQTLQELTALDVLQCKGDVDIPSELCLRDFEITELGHRMLNEGMLPAKPQESVSDFYYDPVSECLLSEFEAKMYKPQIPKIHLDTDVFQDVFPEEKIRSEILLGGYPWWNPAGRIENIKLESNPSILWRNTTATIIVDQGILRITFKNEFQTNYVNSLQTKNIYRHFVEPILIDERISGVSLSEFSAGNINDADGISKKWMIFPEALNEFPEKANVWLVDGNSYLVSRPHQVGARKAIIWFDQYSESDYVSVNWNDTRDGCLITLKWKYPLTDVILASNKQIVSLRRVPVKIGEDVYEIPLALCNNAIRDDTDIVDVFSQIMTAIHNLGDDYNAVIPYMWQTELEFLRDFLKYLNSGPNSLCEKLQRLQKSRIRIREIHGETKLDTPDTWDRFIASTVREHIGINDVELGQLGTLVTSINECKLGSPDQVASAVTAVMDLIQPPQSLEEYSQIVTVLTNGGPAWQILDQSPIYSPEVLKAIANQFQEPNFSKYFVTNNDLDVGVRLLHQTFSEINATLGPNGIDGLSNEENHRTLLKSPSAKNIVEMTKSWVERYDSFCGKSFGLEHYLPGSPLAFVDERIRNIRKLMSEHIDDLDKQVYVLDTNALVDRPEIIKDIRPNELIILSKTVLEELDDLNEKKPDLRPQVRRATKIIGEIRGDKGQKEQIRFEGADKELLPPDYPPRKRDNLILSVALRYRKYQPVLVTGDKIFKMKVEEEKINTMSTEEFARRHDPEKKT
jgi:hypothetical protein